MLVVLISFIGFSSTIFLSEGQEESPTGSGWTSLGKEDEKPTAFDTDVPRVCYDKLSAC